tara:strand:+ start:212 stop:406 length:195 start_codon:yes stop_codon:yes gene_type:complete
MDSIVKNYYGIEKMHEDATEMDRSEWIDKHGLAHINSFDQIQNEMFQHGYQELDDILRGVKHNV